MLLRNRLIRQCVSAWVQLLGLANSRLSRDRYQELAWLLKGWRALVSVPPGDVPKNLAKLAEERVFALRCRSASREFRQSFLDQKIVADWRREFRSYGPDHEVRLRLPREDNDPQREGDLMVLKPPISGGEKGVLMVMYSPSIAKFAGIFDLESLASSYRIVLEPSTWGYQDPDILLFLGLSTEVVVQAQYGPDFEFVERVGGNLVPIRVGAGDWADPSRFNINENIAKRFDLVMVASWLKLKRHQLLFRALAELGDEIRSVALVGMPSDGRTRKDVEYEARRAGVLDKLVWFESIPHVEVCQVIQQSRASLMLSSREGASRVIYESLFCDVPIIISDCNVGVNREHVNSSTGLVAKDEDLASAISQVLSGVHEFSPRAWALQNTGYSNSTRKLQAVLRAAAERRGEPWTQDICGKISAPNLRYARREDWELAQPWYLDLRQHLRPL